MSKVLSEKAINREFVSRDSIINFTRKNQEPDINILRNVFNKDIFDLDEIVIDKTTLNPIFFNSILNIFNKTNDIFSDKGINTLFIARDFIQFNYNDESANTKALVSQTFNAPLFLHQTKISFINEEQISIEISKDPIYNRKLINLLNEMNPSENRFAFTSGMTNKDFEKRLYSTFSFISKSTTYEGIYLGSFDPFEKKIKTEIRKIANMNIDLYESQPKKSRNDYIEQEFDSEPLLVINNPLNFYQKIAVRSALEENTIIYGPPGTGKSEIIVNIIANSIVNEKSLLVTCEKKTALDVLLERLNDIEGLCLFLNSINDEDSFYKKIIDIQELLGLTWSINKENKEEAQHFSLKKTIYDLNSIKAFSKRTVEFYKKIKDSINLDHISKTSLDFSSYKVETDALSKELSLLKGWNELVEYKNKNYGLNDSIWTLITKIYSYEQFKKDFDLDDKTIDEYFKQLEQFNHIKTKSLFAKESKLMVDDFNKRYLEFLNIIEEMNLNSDEKLLNLISNDYFLFEKNMKTMIKIYEKYGYIMEDKNFINFLISNSSNHHEFIKSIEKTPEYYRFTAVDKYIKTGIIKSKGFKIKKFSDTSVLKHIYEVICLFSTIQLSKKCDYLFNNPQENWKYLTADLVFFHLNEKIKSEEMTFLLNNEITKADEKIYNIITKTAISNYIPRIKKVSQFEEVNLKNKEFSDKIMNSYIMQFYKENTQNIETISKNIYLKYIDWLRNELLRTDDEFRKKAFEMFQVAKIPHGINRMKVTTFIKRYYDVLKKVFPIWIGLPSDVSNFCKFEREIFDIVIIDESSQMLMENALPLLYRAKNYVVAGDDKQLKATVAFARKYRTIGRIDDADVIDFDIVESLLDRANVALWNNFILRDHYRSEKQELISFSNEHIYNNKLVFATKNRKMGKAVEVINVKDGYYVDSVNKKEAEQVIKILSNAITNKEWNSFLIITFSANQSEYIQKLIVQSKDSAKFNNLMTNNLLKVRNLENAQGFEADCVILSVSHGRKDAESKLKSSFGPLIQEGGLNRLNVAITRAKSKMYVVKSMYASEMTLNRENKNLMTFYYFIDYLDNIESHYDSLVNVKQIKKTKYKYGNEIIDYIQERISPNIKYTCQYKLGSYLADVVFYHENLNNIELVVCLDYWSKYNEPSELLTSINTQEYLMGINYDFIRIKELEWQFNQPEVLKSLDQMIELINERHQSAKKTKTKGTSKSRKKLESKSSKKSPKKEVNKKSKTIAKNTKKKKKV